MKNNPSRDRFMSECERLILGRRPELAGKFPNLRIWDDLLYFWTCNGITPAIAADRVLSSLQNTSATHIK